MIVFGLTQLTLCFSAFSWVVPKVNIFMHIFFGIFISIAENVGDDFKETISNQKPNTMMMLNSDKSCLCTLLKDGINMNEV